MNKIAHLLFASCALFLLHAPPLNAQTSEPPATPAPAPEAPAQEPGRPQGVPVRPLATPTPPPLEPEVQAPRTMRLPIRNLISARDPIILRTASSTYTIFVPKSARFEMTACRFHLRFTNSIALLSYRSVLRVVVNDVIVAQYALDRQNPTRAVDIDIPVELMNDGFNRVQLIAAQHYTDKCEDPSAPELYTEIDPDRSYFTARGNFKPIPSRLSFLRWWIDEKLWEPYRFNVALPGARPMSDLHLAVGSIVVQGVGLALNNQPFQVNVSNGLREGMDNLVVGTMNELSAFLTATEVGSINGGFLAIKPMPNDPAHAMIIISGRNDQEVGQTALAFGLVNFPLPDSQFATIDSLVLDNVAPYVRNAPLNLPGIYGLTQLGFESYTIKGWNTGSFDLDIYMPGDISRDDASNAELRLNFAYGAGLRKDSTFNVFVNGQFQTAIRLSNLEGAVHNGHRLFLPMKAFQPGRNRVTLTPAMVPLFTEECQILQDENLLFTLYDDSEFVFPRALRRARLPSLGLFSQTTYPYSAPPDGSETAIHVAGNDAETVCAAWTALGKMAQISGALLHRAEISFRMPRSKKSLLVIGTRDQIPPEIVAKAPVSPLEVGRLRYLVSAIPKPQRTARTPVEEFLQKLRGQPVERAAPEAPSAAELNLTADLAEETVAIQFESPLHTGYPVTVLTAGNSQRLLIGLYALQNRLVWDNLRGDLAVWSEQKDSLAVAKVGSDFIYKATSIATRVTVRFDSNPWLLALFVIGLLALLGFGAAAMLRKKARENSETPS